MAHPISDLMSVTMEKIRDMMDANTIIGKPIEVGGVTVVPVCKISMGYGSGGTDFSQKNQKPENPNAFGGGAGMGVTITPVSFLVIREDYVRMLSVEQPAPTAAERVLELAPGVVDKVTEVISKKKADKAEKADAEPIIISE